MPKILTAEERAKKWSENAQKNAERKAERRREFTKTYTVRVSIGSGIYNGIEKAAKNIGIQQASYLRMALIEKLQREGYLSENSDEE